MGNHDATRATLVLVTDELSLAYTVARGSLAGGGVENARDAAKYIEGGMQELLQDRGRTGRALANAAGCNSDDYDPYEVLGRVDWQFIGERFFARLLDELGDPAIW